VHDYHAVSALVAHLTRDPGLAAGIAEVRVRASPVFSPEALLHAYRACPYPARRIRGSPAKTTLCVGRLSAPRESRM